MQVQPYRALLFRLSQLLCRKSTRVYMNAFLSEARATFHHPADSDSFGHSRDTPLQHVAGHGVKNDARHEREWAGEMERCG